MSDLMKKLEKVLDYVLNLSEFYHESFFDPFPDPEGKNKLLIDPLYFMLAYFEEEQADFSDVDFIQSLYTVYLPREMPLAAVNLPQFKQVLLDFYYALYQEKFLTLTDYQKITLMFAEKQFVFFERMTNPEYWEEEKKEIMTEAAEVDDLMNDLLTTLAQETFDNEKPSDRRSHLRLLDSKQPPSKDSFLELLASDDYPERTADPDVSAYQVRIDLEGFKPPIWRRLLIPAGISYYTMHQIIQIAFDWEDSHLHEFQAGDLHFVSEMTDDDFMPFFGGIFEELSEDEAIDPEFQSRKFLTYVYDFGDDWSHKITIEKVIPQSEMPKPAAPVCIKAVREVPEEDTGTMEPIWKPLDQDLINQRLKNL